MIGFYGTDASHDSRPPAVRGLIQEHVREMVASLPPSVRQGHGGAEGPAAIRILAIGDERIRLVVDLLPPDASGASIPILTIERVPSSSVPEIAMREHYRLTRQEMRVAILLAQRRSNAEIAETLRISPHTARRHTENVMLKLNVTSRFSVEDALRAVA